MAKLNLNDIGTSFQARQALNENFNLIEQAFENTLSLNGAAPNAMQATLNLNGNNIVNVVDLFLNDGRSITVLTGEAEASANSSAASAAASELSRQASTAARDTTLLTRDQVLNLKGQIDFTASQTLAAKQSVDISEQNIESIQANVIGLEVQAGISKADAETAANTAVDIQSSLQNSFTEVQTISTGILNAQAQANAVLGLGLGNAIINNDGDLVLTVYDGYFDNVEINNDGELILEWVVN